MRIDIYARIYNHQLSGRKSLPENQQENMSMQTTRPHTPLFI